MDRAMTKDGPDMDLSNAFTKEVKGRTTMNDMQQYTCLDCGKIGASDKNAKPPLCHVCDYDVLMQKSHNGKIIKEADMNNEVKTFRDKVEKPLMIKLRKSNEVIVAQAEIIDEIMGLIEKGILVRNIDNDNDPGWVMQMLSLTTKLKKASEVKINATKFLGDNYEAIRVKLYRESRDG